MMVVVVVEITISHHRHVRIGKARQPVFPKKKRGETTSVQVSFLPNFGSYLPLSEANRKPNK